MKHPRAPQFLCFLVGLLGCMAFGFASCAHDERRLEDQPPYPRAAVPLVVNRDARGHYLVPKCPLCGGAAVLSCVSYRCEKGHSYASADDEF